MAQITHGIRALLSKPLVYSTFQNLMGAKAAWRNLVHQRIRPSAGTLIIDIGCGPGDLLAYLPEGVVYWGFDISPDYIAHAQRRFGARGNFERKLLTHGELAKLPPVDVVVASGVLHHLSDSDAAALFQLAHAALKPGGRLITVDPCWEPGQNPVARYLISKDRGQNVRNRAGYDSLAAELYPNRMVEIRHKRWIPYTHCFMECLRN